LPSEFRRLVGLWRWGFPRRMPVVVVAPLFRAEAALGRMAEDGEFLGWWSALTVIGQLDRAIPCGCRGCLAFPAARDGPIKSGHDAMGGCCGLALWVGVVGWRCRLTLCVVRCFWRAALVRPAPLGWRPGLRQLFRRPGRRLGPGRDGRRLPCRRPRQRQRGPGPRR
jgi:hypothetical protein